MPGPISLPPWQNDTGQALKKKVNFPAKQPALTYTGKTYGLLRPSTYMNLSGKAVGPMANFYNIPPEAILVAHDELDLEPGKARLKIGGGHGGHNGLKDIIKALGNNKNFARLRLGVGHPGHASEVVSYVLRRAPQAEQQLIEDSISAALEVTPELIEGQWNKAMKALHTK